MTPDYVVNVPIMDVWDSPEQTERVTQALLFDPVYVIEESGSFVQGQVLDGYCGYFRRSDLLRPAVYTSKALTVVQDKAQMIVKNGSSLTAIDVYLGTHLMISEEQAEERAILLPDGRLGFMAAAAAGPLASEDAFLPVKAADYAQLLLGAPYLWGGVTCCGVDCSGLVYIAYRSAGLMLPRDADQQFAYCRPLEGVPSVGDLIFFATEEKGVASHVGLCLGENKFIHASSRLGGVVITSLNSPFYKKRFLGWRRV